MRQFSLDPNDSEALDDAIKISLLTHARASDDELREHGIKKDESSFSANRGHWADLLDERTTGSKLWLLDRSEKNDATLEYAKIYTQEALQWTIDGGIFSSLSICKWLGEDLNISINFGGKSLVLTVLI